MLLLMKKEKRMGNVVGIIYDEIGMNGWVKLFIFCGLYIIPKKLFFNKEL
jgi:hypothetical protein